MAFWNNLKKSLQEFWEKLTRPQKIITVIAPLLVAGTLIALIVWAGRPQYVPLFTKIDEASAAQVRSELVSLKIPYQLSDGGTTVSVPQKQVDDARLQLASAGIPQGDKFSFDYLNQMQLGETDADRQLRYQLALQSELANNLKTLAGVQDAYVQIVMPQPSLFVDPSDKSSTATAAVTLKLTPGITMSDDQVRGIANLLAASVQGLQPANVTIIDTNGNVLSDSLNNNVPGNLSGNQLKIQQAVEDNLQKSVQSMLDRALGAGNTIVRASAALDFNQTKIVSETHGPGAVVSQQQTSENSSSGTAPGAVPGTNSNVPGYVANQTGNSTSTDTKTSSTQNYEPDKTSTEQVVSPGAIKRLTISVLANANNVNQAQLSQIQSIVAAAAGMEFPRDQVQVAAIPFDSSALQQEKAAMAQFAINQRNIRYAELGAGALAGLVFLLFLVRRNSKRKRLTERLALEADGQPLSVSKAEEILLAQQQAEEEAQAKLAQKKSRTVDEIEKQKIKEAVEVYARNNSDEVAKLVRTWLSEEH